MTTTVSLPHDRPHTADKDPGLTAQQARGLTRWKLPELRLEPWEGPAGRSWLCPSAVVTSMMMGVRLDLTRLPAPKQPNRVIYVHVSKLYIFICVC